MAIRHARGYQHHHRNHFFFLVFFLAFTILHGVRVVPYAYGARDNAAVPRRVRPANTQLLILAHPLFLTAPLAAHHRPSGAALNLGGNNEAQESQTHTQTNTDTYKSEQGRYC